MNFASLETRLGADLVSIAERSGCELLDATFEGSVLKLIVDRADGVTVDDCVRVSREVSALLDVVDFAPVKYVLEVTSPGLDRKFYRVGDYERFAGERVKVTWQEPGSANRRTDVGTLAVVQRGPERAPDRSPETEIESIEVETERETLTIRLADVLTTRLEPDF